VVALDRRHQRVGPRLSLNLGPEVLAVGLGSVVTVVDR
jgi:hypothetical protein